MEQFSDGPLARPRAERQGGRGGRRLAGGRAKGLASGKPPSGAPSKARGLMEHSATIDAGSLGQSLPAHLSPPHSDPLRRKVMVVETSGSGSSGNIRSDLASGHGTPVGTSVPGDVSDVGGANSSKATSSVVNDVTNKPDGEGPVAIVVSSPAQGQEESDPAPSITSSLPPSRTPQVGMDTPDVAGVSRYIAQLRARGHKRSSSAPVQSQPPPLMATGMGEGGGAEEGTSGEGKVAMATVSSVIVQLSSGDSCAHHHL